MSKKRRKSTKPRKASSSNKPTQSHKPGTDPAKLQRLPVSYQELMDFLSKAGDVKPFSIREETFRRIEAITGFPLLCYATQTRNLPRGQGTIPAFIDDGDVTGFSDLANSVKGDAADILIISNGGSAEAAERIVRLLRERFKKLRFIVPANAYSAATLICFSGDKILMNQISALGPIDPQINGVPARAIKRAFETVEARLKKEGPKALTAYMPLIAKYDLHTLEICTSAEELSEELAKSWLSEYMLRCDPEDEVVSNIVDYFSDYDLHKSHGRSIGSKIAGEVGLEVEIIDETDGLGDLVRSLNNQFEIWFDKTPFYKIFENAHGIQWGRKMEEVTVNIPMPAPISPPDNPT